MSTEMDDLVVREASELERMNEFLEDLRSDSTCVVFE